MEAVGEVLVSTKHFWSFKGKQRCSQIQNHWAELVILTRARENCSRNLVDISWDFGFKQGVNHDVSSRIWMSGLTDTWMTPQDQYGGIICFLSCSIRFEEVVTICFHCMGFGCNAVYPWNPTGALWTQTLHPPPPSAQGWVDNEWIFIFGWTIPLRREKHPQPTVI